MEQTLAISTRGLMKSYGSVRALRGLDLEVRQGEIFGYLGSNGSGKTTTIRCLLDLIRPNGGSVRVLIDTGATLVALPATEAKRLGINYLQGQRNRMQTANGVTIVHAVKLDSVRIGDIEINNVDAVVSGNDAMGAVLLGMSFLNRMEMKRDGQSMALTKRY